MSDRGEVTVVQHLKNTLTYETFFCVRITFSKLTKTKIVVRLKWISVYDCTIFVADSLNLKKRRRHIQYEFGHIIGVSAFLRDAPTIAQKCVM